MELADGRGHWSGPQSVGGQGRGMGQRVREDGRQEGRGESTGGGWPRMMEETVLWGGLGSLGARGLGVSGAVGTGWDCGGVMMGWHEGGEAVAED